MKKNLATAAATGKIKMNPLKITFQGYFKQRYLFLALLPAIIYYLVFHYAPMYGLIIAFKDFRFNMGIMGSPWVGLENFRMFLSSNDFLTVLGNTFTISILQLIIGFPVPIIFALLLNEIRVSALKRTIQTISYIPHFLSWIVLSSLFLEILSPTRGIVNYIITALGFEPIHFMADKNWFRWVLVLSNVWKEMGWNSIIYLAALTSIDSELYEAATIDGAGRFRKAISITLPSIMPIVSIMLIMAIGKIINDNFDQIFNMYSPAVYSVADVISTYVYRMGIVDMEYSFAAAVDLFKNLISFFLIVVSNSIAKRLGDYGIW